MDSIMKKIPDEKSPLLDGRLSAVSVKEPGVTVIVTNFNYEKYIISCLQSIAEQTYKNFKCIVVDDCSTDGSTALVEEFIKQEGRGDKFRLIRHEKNGGQLAAFKTGLMHADGVFVVFVDADDLLLPDFLAAHINVHLCPGFMPVAFTSSDQYQINEKNEITSGTDINLKSLGEYRLIKPIPLFETYWIWATSSSMMFRKSVLDYIMPEHTDNFRICPDHYVGQFANLIGGSMMIPYVYGCFRRHGENNFNVNQIVGRQIPTGIATNYPKHHLVRTGIMLHLLRNHEKYLNLFTESQFVSTLLRVIKPMEIIFHWINFFNKKPDYMRKKSIFFIMRLFMMSSVIYMKSKLLGFGKYLGWYRNLYEFTPKNSQM